jgi:RimJ/RimL family protein N-acetyltransferase
MPAWRETKMTNTITLEGNTIRLVPLSLENLDALCAIGLEPRLWQATTIQVQTRAEMESYIKVALEAQDEGIALPFVIIERSSGKVIGTTRFHSIATKHRHLEIGFTWIALPWQGTVVNTEAKYLMLYHAFESMNCIRVEFRADAKNEQSRRALTRLGAQQEGILRHVRISPHRGVCDLVVYSIIAKEWPQVRSNLEMKLSRTNQFSSLAAK